MSTKRVRISQIKADPIALTIQRAKWRRAVADGREDAGAKLAEVTEAIERYNAERAARRSS